MTSLDRDSQLDRAMEVEGYKVLPPCVLYGKIGQGGMGAVYRGRHLNLDIDVAVKCLRPGLVESDDQFVVRFRREARSAAQINHQNVIRVFDVAEEKGLHYIVMELVQGETARERVVRKKQLSVGEALEILYGAAKGLAEAHRKGFIHRDIKPDNIMISSSGQVKVADLGLAKPAMPEDQASLLSGTNLVMGTPQYMPPEQWENTSNVTPAADVWALGATLYYLLVGLEAIAKDSLPRIMQRIVLQPFPDVRIARPDVPADVAALIAVATQQLPGARYQDAQELAEALEQLETRRQSLGDRDAAPTTQHNTLLSPPPAKTLAKIKFWLDEQGQRAAAAATAPSVERVPAAPVATQRMPAPTRPRTAWPWLVVGAVVALVVVLWQPWRATVDVFALATSLELNKQYIAAIVEVEQVYAANPSLTGKAERLSRLHAASARELAEQERYREALAELDQSLLAFDSPAVQDQQRRLWQRVDRLVQDAFVPTPIEKEVVPQQKVELRGRFAPKVPAELTILSQAVPIAPDGSYQIEVDPRGLPQLAAQARLWNGRTVDLAPVVVRYQASAPKPPAPNTLLPVSLSVPSELELDDDREATLTVRLPRGAELRIDGVAVSRSGTEDIYLHRVRSEQERPLPIELVARQDGFAESRATVSLKRRAAALSFANGPQFADVKKDSEGTAVTASELVLIQGTLNERADTVLANGVPLAELRWGDKGRFDGQLTLTPGNNEVRILAQKRFRQSVVQVLRIDRLMAPTLVAVEPTGEGARVDASSCALVVRGATGALRVTARCGKSTATLVRDTGSDLYRGRIALGAGQNLIVVEAANALDQRTSLELRVERTGTSAAPVVNAVVLLVGTETIDVARNSVVFLRAGASMRIDASDPAAAVTLNGKAVETSAEALQFDLTPLLQEGGDGRFELRLSNSLGRSNAFLCKIVYDTTPPEVEVTAASTSVLSGRSFELRGKWVDANGLRLASVGDAIGELTPGRGVARRGEWSVRMAPLSASTDVTLIVEDRAGNRTTVPVHIEVR